MKKSILLILSLLVPLLLAGCTQVAILAMNQVDLTKASVHGEKLYLMGDFNSKSYEKIRTVIEQNSNIKTVVLTASSGSLDDKTTFKLAKYIRSKGLNTHLVNQSVIASGAVDLFLSGVNRTIERGAKLGIHSWSDGNKQAKDYPRDHVAHDFNSSYIRDMIGDDSFYWYTIYSASADEMYWMKSEEIEQYGLTTQPFLPPSNDETPFRETFSSERRIILGE